MTFPPSQQEVLTKETFRCVKCGECCRPVVKLTKEDITQIEEAGHKKADFVVVDPNNNITQDTLKRVKGVCIFLKKDGEEFVCSLYEHRPDVCRKYPFVGREEFEDCRPKNHVYWMPLKDLI
jgi:Fe-S-cluster containining protein